MCILCWYQEFRRECVSFFVKFWIMFISHLLRKEVSSGLGWFEMVFGGPRKGKNRHFVQDILKKQCFPTFCFLRLSWRVLGTSWKDLGSCWVVSALSWGTVRSRFWCHGASQGGLGACPGYVQKAMRHSSDASSAYPCIAHGRKWRILDRGVEKSMFGKELIAKIRAPPPQKNRFFWPSGGDIEGAICLSRWDDP